MRIIAMIFIFLVGIKYADAVQDFRLSQALVPIWYNLTLKTYLPGFDSNIPSDKNLTFDGVVLIKVRVLQTTDRIELNADGLKFNIKNIAVYQIHKASLDDSEILSNKIDTSVKAFNSDVFGAYSVLDSLLSAKISVISINVSEKLQKVNFHLNKNLDEGADYYIRIAYSGLIRDDNVGLYLTHYKLNGKTRYGAATQFESIYARRMLPCFDEPEFKAIFSLRVVHPRGSTAVSNAIELVESQPTDDPEWLVTTYDETPHMSSYLLALVVSDFKYIEGHTNRKIRFRTWARPNAVNQTEFALQAGIKVLEFYEDYFGIPFPKIKLDMMALPQFRASAMENWGLVLYGETSMLYSPKINTKSNKMWVAEVIAHELAHQWFGNLVTMKWWNDLFLNEGFATLIEKLGIAAIEDNQALEVDGIYSEVKYALGLDDQDELNGKAHPLEYAIQKAEDIEYSSNQITYHKGCSILQMIRMVMGKEHFKKGLIIYLNRYEYGNADHKNFLDALTEAVPDSLLNWNHEKLQVDTFASLWIEQAGYPVVEVWNLDSRRVQLTQKSFKLECDKEKDPESKCSTNAQKKASKKWKVPIWYSVNGAEHEMVWLEDRIVIEVPENARILVNSQFNGFYRIQYDISILNRFIKLLIEDHQKFSVTSRTQIIDDTFALAESGDLPYEAALNTTKYLTKEGEYSPWNMALHGFNTILEHMNDVPEAKDIREYIKRIIRNHFDNTGNILDQPASDNAQAVTNNLLNLRLLEQMCKMGDARTIERITFIYQTNFVKLCQKEAGGTISSECSTVPLLYRDLVYCEGVRHGSEGDWETTLELSERETVQIEKERLLMALTCSNHSHKLANHKQELTLLQSIIKEFTSRHSQYVIGQVKKFMEGNGKITKKLDNINNKLRPAGISRQTNKKWMDKNFVPLSKWFKAQNSIINK